MLDVEAALPDLPLQYGRPDVPAVLAAHLKAHADISDIAVFVAGMQPLLVSGALSPVRAFAIVITAFTCSTSPLSGISEVHCGRHPAAIDIVRGGYACKTSACADTDSGSTSPCRCAQMKGSPDPAYSMGLLLFAGPGGMVKDVMCACMAHNDAVGLRGRPWAHAMQHTYNL